MVAIDVKHLSLAYRIPRKLTLALRDRRLPKSDSRIVETGGSGFVQALNDVSFSLRRGDRLGLVGANGAGKTTLLQVLYGIYQPTAGFVDIRGRVDALFNISLGFRQEATGRRNIELRGMINGWSNKEIAARMDKIIAFSELGDFIDMPLKSYSAGMATRLAFSIATSFEPEILLMDEWIGAGDAAFQEKARTRMMELTKKAGIIVLASHNNDLLKRVTNKVLELKAGRVNAFKSADEWFGELEAASANGLPQRKK
jgi:ABC-type polysaccharide/polyol phosphate transport system ATPase subunit